ncbi:nuclear transport factor 2 family protein [Tropicibacter sp. R16_0]|uniref:nuclear transport factor 2 family protein n=1 Tax=Tropicibacter sp. R16_0 TaxID=2821102 RepID=UPI001ADBEFB9|nr:nuclear transport factor 2 family protein [Tropicibacter sp. R16_0]MBO9450677.1 nuclear transport factor 2 family protein [Tropicibacter sp. R16_0]
MKTALPTVAFLTALSTAAAPAMADQALTPVGTPVEGKIRTLVSSIPLAVDRAAYGLAQRAFAPEVVIDYTSLWGGEPATMTPADLMTAWKGIVPGFDATWHELGPVTVTVDGDMATAEAFVDARHWIGDDLWRPIGSYYWDVERVDNEWRVTRMEFDMTQELGDRGLAAQAMERAK